MPSWGFHGSYNFSCGYFVGLNFFLMSILWVQNFFSRVFHGYELFSSGHFVGTKFFLVGFSWVRNFFAWDFRGSIFFIVTNIVIQDFSVVN